MPQAVRTTAPTTWPVTVGEVLAQCHEDSMEQAALVEMYISAATALVEQHCGIAITPQGWTQKLDRFPAGDVVLSVGPVSAVTSITYVDTDGEAATFATEDYAVDLASVEARIRPVDTWPDTSDVMNAVTIVWTAGASCPAALKQAILMTAAHWYDNRGLLMSGGLTEIPMGAKALMETARRFRG